MKRGLAGLARPDLMLELNGAGVFGGRRAARVVWLGLARGAEPAAELARAVESVCREAGLEPEPRPFRPHITLARARARAGAPAPELPLPPRLPAWRAGEMVLFESRLGGGKPPRYVPLERYPLDG